MIKNYNDLRQYILNNAIMEYEENGQVRYEGVHLTNEYNLMYDHFNDCITLDYMVDGYYMHSIQVDEPLLHAIISLGKMFQGC